MARSDPQRPLVTPAVGVSFRQPTTRLVYVKLPGSDPGLMTAVIGSNDTLPNHNDATR